MRDRQTSECEKRLCGLLVHRQRGGPNTRMGVGNSEPVEHALNRTVFAEASVQGVEHDIRLRRQRGDHGGQIRTDLNRIDLETGLPKCRDHLQATRPAYLTFGGDAAVQHRDPGHCTISGLPAGMPMRRISQSRVTPVATSTRRRTSSAKPSMSAAVAFPVLIRKLQCFSETTAPPLVRPRQPAASISSHAFIPSGLRNVDPPVRARTGCDASRAAFISAMRAAISPGAPGIACRRTLVIT